MISTEVYAKIRQYKKKGFSMRKAAELLSISRNTIKRYWDGAHTPDEKKAYPATLESPQKEKVMAALQKYYQENQTIGKQRINARTAWETIRETHNVGESTVRRYARELKGKNPEGFIPLSFDPGEMMQVDWCEVKVNIQGNVWKAPLFCAVLPYSYGIYAMIMPNMKMPCFIEAHVEAFQFFEGIPQRILYDNLKTAVFSGFGKNAVKQERFRMLEAHYAFDAVFANAESGNEKGGVENLCSLIRQVAFTPMPKGQNLKEIQAQVIKRCLDYNQFHKIRDRQRPIAPMLTEERAQLMPLPLKPFSAYAETEATVGSDLTFRYDATKYSAPLEYIGKTVTIRATSYRIEAWYRGGLVCTHERPFVKGEHQYLPEHYLTLLERKPRAIPNAKPLKYGVLPPELEKFRKLNRDKDKYEQLANILLLGQNIDAEMLLAAVDWANRTGSPTFDSVRFYLTSRNLEIENQSKSVTAATDP
ncbi:MAG: IS21 family transposase, partial [Smithella sp.]